MSKKISKVVIIGAGFGGLAAAKKLANTNHDVLVIDQKNHHLFQPLLYQVATADLAPTDISWPIRSILSYAKNISVIMATVSNIDLQNQKIYLTDNIHYDFDFLVVAVGSNVSYFGHNDWQQFSPGLKTVSDALSIRKKILTTFELAERTADLIERQKLLNFVIIGGGPTGVELAGAIAELAHSMIERDFHNIKVKDLNVILIEASSRLLNAFSDELSKYTLKSLESLHVDIRLNDPVQYIDSEGVKLKNDYIYSHNVIWGAGVHIEGLDKLLNCTVDNAGRAIVNTDLTLPNYPNIFVIGDAAKVIWYDNTFVPGIAPAAKQMGKYVAYVIQAKIAHKNIKILNTNMQAT